MQTATHVIRHLKVTSKGPPVCHTEFTLAGVPQGGPDKRQTQYPWDKSGIRIKVTRGLVEGRWTLWTADSENRTVNTITSASWIPNGASDPAPAGGGGGGWVFTGGSPLRVPAFRMYMYPHGLVEILKVPHLLCFNPLILGRIFVSVVLHLIFGHMVTILGIVHISVNSRRGESIFSLGGGGGCAKCRFR